MSISNLIEGLQKANIDLTPREVAEMLWLWVKTSPEEDITPGAIPETPQSTTSAPETPQSTTSVPEAKVPKVDLYPKVTEGYFIKEATPQERYPYPLQVPDAPAIDNYRQLERALKSLRRNFKSLREQELDEDKTVNTIVEQTLSNPTSPIWIPIFKPILTHRWLDLVLVIEVNNSLVLWKQTIIELRQFLRRLGIFNSLESWGLQVNLPSTPPNFTWHFKLISRELTSSAFLTFLIFAHQKEGIKLFRYDDVQMRPYPPEAINSQGKNTLILLVSDLVSPVWWYRPEIYILLRQWSSKGMVNLLQLLPERLWSRTVLGQQNRLNLRAIKRISTNQKLIPLLSTKKAKLHEFKLPVTSLELNRIEEWSRFLVGIGDNQCIGYGIASLQLSFLKLLTIKLSPQERVERFQTIASPTALKLAELLSSSLVTLPVIRVIKYTMLPQANQSHVAEVLMGGLFKPLKKTITLQSDLDEVEFEFFEGVREELLSWLTIDQISSTIEKVSAYIANKMGKSLKDFEALLISSKYRNSDLAKQIYPFAQVQAKVLQQLGGAYAAFAEEIKIESFKFETEVATIIVLEKEKLPINILIENQVIKVSGETCPSGFIFVTYQEALENRNLLSQKLDRWDIARLADGASMDGRGYGLKIHEKDERKLGHSLCKKILQEWEFETPTVDRRGEIIKTTTYKASYFTDILGDRVELEMVLIPEGRFLMGSPETEKGSRDNERPQHNVAISSFLMGRYPVTQAQWRAIANRTDLRRKIDLEPDPSKFKGDDRPVETVNSYEALEFCQRLSNLTKRNYRLPSEAEWEYACRARTTTPFHFGETITSKVANYDCEYTYKEEKKGQPRQETTSVGYFKTANQFGLYDMHGNVWEWCQNNWYENYQEAPNNAIDWISNSNLTCVIRGGGWLNEPNLCRSSYRLQPKQDRRFKDIGFRIVCIEKC